MKEFLVIFIFIITNQALLTKGCPQAYDLSIGNQYLPSTALLSALGGCGCSNSISYDPIRNLPPPAGIPAKIGGPGPTIYDLLSNQCLSPFLPGTTAVPAVGYQGPIAYEIPIGNQCLLPPAPVVAPSIGYPGPVAYGVPIGNPYQLAQPAMAPLPPPPCPCSGCHFLRKIAVPPPCI